MINRWIRCLAVLALAVMCLSIAAPVHALSEEDRRAIDLDSVWHKTYKPVKICTTSGASTVNGTSGSGQPGALYLLGDSIGTQFGPGLATNLATQGWSVQTNAASGRTLPQGLEVIDQDAAIIQASDVVVIELGTNTAGFSPENVGATIDKVRFLNPTATIYWVDTAVVQRQDYAQSLNSVNSIIYAQSSQKNYQVISWNKKVFGDAADPQNINADAPDNGYIRHADQFVHLTDEGVTAMAELIGTVVQNSSANAALNCPPPGSGCLVGGDNAEKVWNFFKDKGMAPHQIAGIIGNMSAESHIEPRLVQYGTTNSRGEVSVPGEPSSLDDTPTSGGYGIVQFTPGTKILASAERLGMQPSDLLLQLTILWEQLNGEGEIPEKAAGDALFATTTVEEATVVFETRYERHAPDTSGPVRLQFAIDALSTFGSNTTPGASAC